MVWMTGGTSFTNRSNVATGTAAQDFAPQDIGIAHQSGWVAMNQTQFPALLDFANYGGLSQVGAIVPAKTFQTGVPMILAPTGSMANNGVLTGGTAFPTGFMNGGTYQYFPAGAIAAGSLAGWYYTLMSSTTAGVVYNNIYTAGQPYVPAVPTPFVTTGPGAFTGVTTAVVALSFPIAANTMGPNGLLEISMLIGYHGSINNKTVTVKVGAATIFSVVNATAATLAYQALINWGNQGQTGFQYAQTVGAMGALTTAQTYTAIDTTQIQTVTVNFTNATATDWISLDNFSAIVTPG